MKNKILAILFLVAISFTTVVYSAYNTQLQIKGEAMVRSIQKIRITNITIYERINGAYETYNNRYNKDVTFMYATLPVNSSIAYEVEITNEDTIGYLVESITEQAHTNPNVDISISLNVNDSIRSQNTKTFIIRFTNNTTQEQLDTLIYKYAFKEDLFTIQYNLNGGSISGSNPTTYSTTDVDFLLINPTKSGYKFAGWTGTDLSERTLNITVDTASAKNLSYTANWKKLVTNNTWWGGDHIGSYLSLPVTRNGCSMNDFLIDSANGRIVIYINYSGSCSGNSAPTWLSGQSPVWYEPSVSSRTKDGRSFNYYCDTGISHGSTAYRTHYYSSERSAAGFFIEIDEYKLNNQRVYYNGNGGIVQTSSRIYNPGFMVDLSTSNATRADYTCLGWSSSTDGDIYSSHKMQGGRRDATDTTLYAQWAKTNN